MNLRLLNLRLLNLRLLNLRLLNLRPLNLRLLNLRLLNLRLLNLKYLLEPETVEPETVEPEIVEPEIVEPEIVEPETVELETVTNSIGMKFKLIPAGEFMMGSSESPEELAKAFPGTKPEWFEDERPQHKVRITKPFYLGVTEVTQEQYEKVMGKNPSCFSKTGRECGRVKGTDTSNFPVEKVSWDDAVEFCKKLSAKEGETYRLPTEAEWEYACRAGSTTRYCFGDDESQLGEYAWFGENSDGTNASGGQKETERLGLVRHARQRVGMVQDWYERGLLREITEG